MLMAIETRFPIGKDKGQAQVRDSKEGAGASGAKPPSTCVEGGARLP